LLNKTRAGLHQRNACYEDVLMLLGI